MADILIKNMEMPRGDDIISAYIHSDGSVSYVYVNEDRPSVTRAVELPPHGRLLDADEIVRLAEQQSIIHFSAMSAVRQVRTFMEANNGNNN